MLEAMMKREGSTNIYKLTLILSIIIFATIGLIPINPLLFHTLIELFCTFISMGMLMISLNTYKFSSNQNNIFLGIAYGFVGLFNIFHMLASEGIGIFPLSTLNQASQLWIVTRYLESLSVLMTCFFLKEDKRLKLKKMVGIYTIVSILCFLSIFYWNNFPVSYVEGMGLTTFKVVNEYIIFGIFLLSTLLVIRNKQHINTRRYYLMLAFLMVSSISEIFFASFVVATNISFKIGHMTKLLSFYLIYKAIIETALNEPYKSLNLLNNKLRSEAQKLEKLNNDLQQEIDHRKVVEVALENEKEILRASEEKFRTLIEIIPDAIIVHDGNEIIYANPSCKQILDTEHREELTGRRIMEFVHPESKELAEKMLAKKLQGEDTEPFNEYKIINTKGRVIDVELASVNFYDREKKRMMIIGRDLSERQEAERLKIKVEEEAQLLQAAIEYDKLKTEFFSTISHELKTPLNIILGTIQLLISIHAEYDDPHCQNYSSSGKYIGVMRQNCYRLLRLINNLIDLTKIDGGFLKTNFSNHNIVSLIEDISLSVNEYAESKGISMIFDTDVEEKMIACDPDHMERVILNLLSNAMKFTEPGGTIEVDIQDKGERIVISIKDTGIGIPKDMLEKIFDRFRQVDSKLHRKAEGSGVGLSLVKGLVEMHGGSIWVESKLGYGSQFFIELPAGLVDTHDGYDEIAVTVQPNIERISIEFSDIYL